ncbi:MAG: hypothetical protein BGN96_12195 [Bacteroidales bacterium 45-6]|nr:MAG: hypothetical protein BGN96_12195 [Bacteroidales bacterium 45-6]
MEVTVLKTPGPYCFLGNPVVFELQTAVYGAIDVSISCNGETFTQSYYPFLKDGVYRCKVDISGFLFKTNLADSFPQGLGMVTPFAGHSVPFTFTIKDSVFIFFINDTPVYNDYIFSGTAFPGGVNDQTLALLAKNSQDIFSFRLNVATRNFLFTTRTHRNVVRLKESEMYPFLFLHPLGVISFRSGSGNSVEAVTQIEGTICLLDIYKVKDQFLSDFSENALKIEVLVGTALAFTFLIGENKTTEERYRIRFRNSLGAFEVLEVIGVASHEPEFGDETIWKELTGSNFYENRRDRVPMTETIKVETGYKSKDDLLFVRDLVCSDEAYFYYPDGTYFRCTVKADKMAYRQKKIAPTSVALVVTEVGSGKYVSPELDRASLDELGIYNETFDKTYTVDFM